MSLGTENKYTPLAMTSPGERDAEELPFDRPRAEPARLRRLTNALPKVLSRPRGVLPVAILSFGILACLSILLHSSSTLLPVAWTGQEAEASHGNSATPLPETDNPYFWKGEVWTHNEEVSAKLDRCAALGLLRETRDPLPPLSPQEEDRRISLGCGTNETTVVLLTSIYHAEAFGGQSSAGEVVWAQSLISTLNAYGYSYMFSSLGWWNHDMAKTMEYWRKHRGQIRLIFSDPEQVDVCYRHRDQNCLTRTDNPEGVEPWRILSYWYWDDARHPLGAGFTVSPAKNDNYYLGYSIEPTCAALPKADAATRAHPPQAYMLAKQSHYLDQSPEFAWTIPALSHLQGKLRVIVAGGLVDDDSRTTKKIAAAGLRNYGKLGKIEFYDQLARSFVLLGVGRPKISPSPWDALCMGVPFINPVMKWNESVPEDKSQWEYQHWRMKDLEPPYMYTVKAHDYEALARAVKSARDRPISSFVPPHMKFDFVCRRMAETLNADWKARAQAVLEERRKSGHGDIYISK